MEKDIKNLVNSMPEIPNTIARNPDSTQACANLVLKEGVEKVRNFFSLTIMETKIAPMMFQLIKKPCFNYCCALLSYFHKTMLILRLNFKCMIKDSTSLTINGTDLLKVDDTN